MRVGVAAYLHSVIRVVVLHIKAFAESLWVGSVSKIVSFKSCKRRCYLQMFCERCIKICKTKPTNFEKGHFSSIRTLKWNSDDGINSDFIFEKGVQSIFKQEKKTIFKSFDCELGLPINIKRKLEC